MSGMRRSVACGAIALAAAAFVATPLTLDEAGSLAVKAVAAKDGNNGNGNGNGGGNGNGNGGGRDNGRDAASRDASDGRDASGRDGVGRDASASRDAPGNSGNAPGHNKDSGGAKAAAAADPGRYHDKHEAKEAGNIAGKLGALNAAHASPNALANAAPNSRVGRIASYVDRYREAAALAERQDDLKDRLNRLERALDGDALTPERRAELEARAAATKDALAKLRAERYHAEREKRDALEAAANKPVTREVVGAVNDLLGLDPY